MSYVFTSSNGFLKIVNAATGYESSTATPVVIASGNDAITGPYIFFANVNVKMALTEIATIGGIAALTTIDGIVNQITSLASISSGASNIDTGSLLATPAISATGAGPDQTNFNGRGVQILINVSAMTGTIPSVIFSVQGKDAASGTYYNILSAAAIVAVGTQLLTIYPGGLVTANVAVNAPLPRTWRISYVISGTTPVFTATIGASVII